jgi:hypothetical protein
MTTPLEALASLSRQDPTIQSFWGFHEEVNAEKNERGAAIILAANAEIALRYAIKRHLIVTDHSEKYLFHSSGPLRSFEAKIRIGYSMGLYREQTKNNLETDKPRGILPDFPNTRQRFQKICEAVTHNIFMLGVSISPDKMSSPPNESFSTRATWTPLQ